MNRIGFIGGSDAPVIAGVSKWKTPLALYLEKRGETPPEPDSEPMRWGRALEPLIRQRYAEETGRKVLTVDTILRHPHNEWMVAHVDGIVTGGPPMGLEVKTARNLDGWGEPGTDQIPDAYILQVQHYMAVTAYPVWDVAALIGGQDFRIYTVEANRSLQDSLIEIEADFWSKVNAGTPPDATCLADVRARWGRHSTASKIVADDKAMEAFARLAAASANIKAATAEKEAAMAVLCGHMGINDTLVTDAGTVLATWKQSKGRTTFDAERFKNEYPDLYREYLKTGEPSRRFLPKVPKED